MTTPFFGFLCNNRLATLTGLMLCLAGGQALACTASGARTVRLTADLPSTTQPGSISLLSGNPAWITGCTSDLALPMEILLEPAGLTRVSTVNYEGKTYATYQTSPTSPLFFFPVSAKTSAPGQPVNYERFPAAEGTGSPVSAYRTGSDLINYPYLGVVARAGMQAMGETLLGTEVAKLVYAPYANRFTVYVTVNLVQPTCALSDTAFALDDITANTIAAVGDTSREQTFNVSMQCEAAGIPVRLTLTDANDAAATGSHLKPTASATAQGVQVQLLRAGTPVVLGQQWTHGTSVDGRQDIPLQARYARTGNTLKTGIVEGQAILTADYR